MDAAGLVGAGIREPEWRPNRLLTIYVSSSGWRGRPGVGVCAGVIAFSIACLFRIAMQPLLPPGFPFLTFFPAVILSSFLCGARAGIVCAVFSGVAAWYCFIPPLNSFEIDRSVVTALALFTLVVGVDIFLIHLMQQMIARIVRAGATTQRLLDQQHDLVIDLQRETRSRVMHQDLAEKSLLLDLALKAADAGTWHYCVATRRALLSAEMARQHGLGDAEIEIDVEREWRPLVHPEDADRTLAALGSAIETRGSFEADFRILLATGETRWVSAMGRVQVDAAGEAEWVVGLTFNVTARKMAEQRIAHLALHDPLTGLANRTQFRDQLLREIALVKRGSAPIAVLCMDLDRFKSVNDTLGHAAGDALLRLVADRMRSVVRLEDTVARLGGDEFVVIQTGLARAADAAILAERLTRAIAAPFLIEGHEVSVGVSIGVALVPSDGMEPDAIYRKADRALYDAKAEGRGTYRWAAQPDVDRSSGSRTRTAAL